MPPILCRLSKSLNIISFFDKLAASLRKKVDHNGSDDDRLEAKKKKTLELKRFSLFWPFELSFIVGGVDGLSSLGRSTWEKSEPVFQTFWIKFLSYHALPV